MHSGSAISSVAVPRKKVLSGRKLVLAHVAGLLMRLWVATLRITADERSSERFSAMGEPMLFVLWHNRLFIAGHLARRYRAGRPLHALISTSNDGAWLTAFFATMGLKAVRGSSSKGGREAVNELLQILRDGGDAGITPDGPRGPIYVAKPGALLLARRSGASIAMLGADYESAWKLRSWDGFLLPHPFSRIHLTIRPYILGTNSEADELARFNEALCALNRRS
jgi:lysophospholipid acyltransferase (LPLAT)-like uncharacterized protein